MNSNIEKDMRLRRSVEQYIVNNLVELNEECITIGVNGFNPFMHPKHTYLLRITEDKRALHQHEQFEVLSEMIRQQTSIAYLSLMKQSYGESHVK